MSTKSYYQTISSFNQSVNKISLVDITNTISDKKVLSKVNVRKGTQREPWGTKGKHLSQPQTIHAGY